MNCIDVRRELRAGWEKTDPAVLDHLSGCAACAAEATRAARFEQRLREALSVPVPDALASRILLRHDFHPDVTGPRRRTRLLALAASLALLLTGAVAATWWLVRPPGLDQEVIELVNQAGFSFQSREPVAAGRVAAALAPVGLALDGEIGEVTFASRCFVRGRLAGHLVVQGETAPVTVFLVPERLVDRRADVASPTLAGVLVPARGGTIAILGAPGEPLSAIEARVRSSVRWPA